MYTQVNSYLLTLFTISKQLEMKNIYILKPNFILNLILVILILLVACEEQIQRRVVFEILSINTENTVVPQNEFVNLTVSILIAGPTNEQSIDALWECEVGEFSSINGLATVWTAPNDILGDFIIKFSATFMGATQQAELAIKVVQNPADNWGSISGYLMDNEKQYLNGIIISVTTGESDTTGTDGYFYLKDIPQGTTGLQFSDIGYNWATELAQRITIEGGSHQHLGNIVMYKNVPPVISDYEGLPEHQAILLIEHDQPDLLQHYELYRASDITGTNAQMIRMIQPGIRQFLIREEVDHAFYALKSVPLHGKLSELSDWTHVPYFDVIDPDAEMSFFEYNNFFTALLYWQPVPHPEYYKGYKIVESTDTGWVYRSPLLPPAASEFELQTAPGMSGEYFIISYTLNDLYNSAQPDEQKIMLEVPAMEYPTGFNGSLRRDSTIRLTWEPIANNNTWYSGYLLEKKIITDTMIYDWEELVRMQASVTGIYTDEVADSGNIYRYRISSVAYPDMPGNPVYSEVDSISISTK